MCYFFFCIFISSWRNYQVYYEIYITTPAKIGIFILQKLFLHLSRNPKAEKQKFLKFAKQRYFNFHSISTFLVSRNQVVKHLPPHPFWRRQWKRVWYHLLNSIFISKRSFVNTIKIILQNNGAYSMTNKKETPEKDKSSDLDKEMLKCHCACSLLRLCTSRPYEKTVCIPFNTILMT